MVRFRFFRKSRGLLLIFTCQDKWGRPLLYSHEIFFKSQTLWCKLIPYLFKESRRRMSSVEEQDVNLALIIVISSLWEETVICVLITSFLLYMEGSEICGFMKYIFHAVRTVNLSIGFWKFQQQQPVPITFTFDLLPYCTLLAEIFCSFLHWFWCLVLYLAVLGFIWFSLSLLYLESYKVVLHFLFHNNMKLYLLVQKNILCHFELWTLNRTIVLSVVYSHRTLQTFHNFIG